MAVQPVPGVSAGPLEGVRVLELGNFIAGPFAGQLFGDYGAEVIKVEPPQDGDAMRRWGLVHNDEGLWWPTIARNKRSVALDLRDERGRAAVARIAAGCDVMIENFRPGRLAAWGLDHATLTVSNPRLVTVHISGYGQTGPRAQETSFGSIGEAMGGIRSTTGSPDRPPSRTGISLGDALAAIFGVIGGIAAYSHAQRSGVGQEVDVAIYEAVFALMESVLADYEVAGVVRQRSGSSLPGVAPSNVYPSADTHEVLIAANGDGVFRRLCTAMGRPELADDERYATHEARGARQRELDDLICVWTRSKDLTALLDTLSEHAVPSGRIFTAPDMLTDPHFAARRMVIRRRSETGVEIPMPGVVPTFSRTPGTVRSAGPRLGADTRDVLTAIAGLSAEDVDDLINNGLALA